MRLVYDSWRALVPIFVCFSSLVPFFALLVFGLHHSSFIFCPPHLKTDSLIHSPPPAIYLITSHISGFHIFGFSGYITPQLRSSETGPIPPTRLPLFLPLYVAMLVRCFPLG